MELDQYKNSCGQIDHFFTVDQLHGMVEIFRHLEPVDGKNNNCFGIDRNHKAYLWLNTVLLNPIANHFNPELKLVFAMLLDCTEPFDLHHDLKDIPDPNGKHFLSFLIPYSVNNNIALCNQVSTMIFNESFPYDHVVENNVSYLHETMISHISKDVTYNITLKKNLTWSLGSLCWWDSHLLHVSNNFLKDGYSSKQAIVIHTYVL